MNDIALALLLVRLIGFGFAAHGAQKLFGWFGGYGLAGTGGFFESIGFRPGRTFAFLAAAGEIAAGILTILGLGGALGPALVVMVMLVAVLTVHAANGFFQTNNGWELNGFYIATAAAIAYAGNGSISLDSLLGLTLLTGPAQASIALAAAVVLALLNLAARRPAPQKAANA